MVVPRGNDLSAFLTAGAHHRQVANTCGRDQSQWDSMVETAVRFLEEQARLGRTPSYTEVNSAIARRGGHPSFDFDQDSERAGMGELLGQVTRRKYDEVGAMLSAIVIYLNENDAGPGFYRLASVMGLLRSAASKDQKLDFWLQQVSLVHNHYRSGHLSLGLGHGDATTAPAVE